LLFYYITWTTDAWCDPYSHHSSKNRTP